MSKSEGIISANRLPKEVLKRNFSDLHPPLDPHEAAVAADRCYYCFDAPCVTACPTSIDIPAFIRSISTGKAKVAGRTIFDQNILGGMCARVCPTENLCEQACVRQEAEGKPVEIGRLQRFATDAVMETGDHPYKRAQSTGKKVLVVGAGPAGLACAHRLAMKGHEVEIMEARAKGGGLNEYGIAAYKSTNNFAQNELDWLLQIGGISISYGKSLNNPAHLDELASKYDAVFLGCGLGGVRALDIAKGKADDSSQICAAVDFISALRQATDLSSVAVGSRVVVIGGGMTAVDAAVQSKKLGASEVTLAYRGPKEKMSASQYEQELAQTAGVTILYGATPTAIEGEGALSVIFDCGEQGSKTIEADQVMMAIGQTLIEELTGLALEGGKIKIDEQGKTSRAGVWAGGDCASGGDDLTVTAVAEGRDAAESIHKTLVGEG